MCVKIPPSWLKHQSRKRMQKWSREVHLPAHLWSAPMANTGKRRKTHLLFFPVVLLMCLCPPTQTAAGSWGSARGVGEERPHCDAWLHGAQWGAFPKTHLVSMTFPCFHYKKTRCFVFELKPKVLWSTTIISSDMSAVVPQENAWGQQRWMLTQRFTFTVILTYEKLLINTK